MTHGLANLGNTCYLNSALQALFHSKPFRQLLTNGTWETWRHDDRKGLALTESAAEVVTELMTDGQHSVVPSRFVTEFIRFANEFNDQIRRGAQGDAAEAIQIILDGIHTQIAREVNMTVTGIGRTPSQKELIQSMESWATFYKKEYSMLLDNYYGQTQTRVTCTTCKTSSTRYEPWSVLKVPIPGAEKAGVPAPTLADCLAAYFADETIDDYSCDTCKEAGRGRGTALIQHSISRLPSYLILSLKRFTNRGAKIRARINYDENCISFEDWRSWADLQPQARYRVVSTVEHLGGSHGGHYCARGLTDGGWCEYDDTRVIPTNGLPGADTYVLILHKLGSK